MVIQNYLVGRKGWGTHRIVRDGKKTLGPNKTNAGLLGAGRPPAHRIDYFAYCFCIDNLFSN